MQNAYGVLQVVEEGCPVFCQGEILETVQMASIFEDQKHFVDMPMKFDPGQILEAWKEVDTSSKTSIESFINSHFVPLGSDIQPIIPEDWNAFPAFLNNVNDPALQQWARQLNGIWRDLGRRPTDDVYDFPERHSLIAPKHPIMLVPGGRFREEYYWDTYFVQKGLLLSGMLTTCKKLIENFAAQVETYGYVLNGARTYYKTRSQPPVLTLMVKDYIKTIKEKNLPWKQWLSQIAPSLVKEHNFWMQEDKHLVRVGKHKLNRYFSEVGGPRPEMFRKDVETASHVPESERIGLFREIVATAESGWDFSSRWFADGMNRNTCRTSSVLPVDLNMILLNVEIAISEFFHDLGDDITSEKFRDAFERRKSAILTVMWHPSEFHWRDIVFQDGNWVKSPSNSVSNFFGLWGNHFDETDLEVSYKDIVQAFVEQGFMLPGGIPATLDVSAEQWDFPNAWAPSTFIIFEGLSDTPDPLAQQMAFIVASTWLQSAFISFRKTLKMHEKYDARYVGEPGGGGEYEGQTGYGWTNGICIHFLNKFGNILSFRNESYQFEL